MKAHPRRYGLGWGLFWGLGGLLLFIGSTLGGQADPSETILRYYQALKEMQFEEAYGYLSQQMRSNKTLEQWVKSTREVFEGGKVEIQKVSTSPAEVDGNRARVKSTVVAKDMFNVKGLIEYNLEHLVKEAGRWKLEKTEFLTVEVLE